MPAKVIPATVFGGVDSRSNPLDFPQNRSLRCRNFIIDPAGYLELRQGYTLVSTGTPAAAAAHSLFQYQTNAGVKYLLSSKTTTLYVTPLTTGAEATLGSSLTNARLSCFFSNNYIHGCNGTDLWFYDGTTLRKYVGVRAPTAANVANVTVRRSMPALSDAEQAAITVTGNSSGGSLGATTGNGYQVYVGLYNTSLQELGPFRSVGSRITFASGSTNKISLAGLVDAGTISTNAVKLYGVTADGGDFAGLLGAAAKVTDGVADQSGTTVGIDKTSHGLSDGDVVEFRNTTDPTLDGVYVITNAGGNRFVFTVGSSATRAIAGPVYMKLVKTASATTTQDITAVNLDTGGIDASLRVGIAGSTIGGSQPGYQFWAAFRHTVTGDVSNGIAIGRRVYTDRVANYIIAGITNIATIDSEWEWVLGRTDDGAEVGHAIIDSDGDFISVGSGVTSVTVTDSEVDHDYEMPTRNTPPQAFEKWVWANGRGWANLFNSPDVYYTDSETESRAGKFWGIPAHCWPTNNFKRFPTNESVSGMFTVNDEVLVGTSTHCAILHSLNGVIEWGRVWNIGIAAKRAGVNTNHGFFALTGDKRLMTMTYDQYGNEEPVTVSDEYELALLSQIGDSYMATAELVYLCDPSRNIDRILINANDGSGNPLSLVHDFKLKDAQSPYGQAREIVYAAASPLASAYTVCRGLDSNGKDANYALATNGKIYQLEKGNTDAGSEFTGDYVGLRYTGTEHPKLDYIDTYGDAKHVISFARDFDAVITTSGDWETIKASTDTNYETNYGSSDYHSRSYLLNTDNADIRQIYLRLQLTSHSSDAPASYLSTPPHLPLETYGRIYMIRPAVSDPRED